MFPTLLCRFFSRKSRSSTAYNRLHTPPPPIFPIYHQSHPVSPRRVTIDDDDGDDFKRTVKAPPLPIPTIDVDSVREDAASDGDYDGGGDGGGGNNEKTSAMYRIENELRAMKEEEAATHCSFGPVGDDIFRWEAVVIGPAVSCYEGGIFNLSIKFPSDYPLSPPSIKFLTKIFHPNVEKDGSICIDILKENWSSALTIEKLMLSICSILSNPDVHEDTMNEASGMFLNDWLKYNEIAREWTKQYAMGN